MFKLRKYTGGWRIFSFDRLLNNFYTYIILCTPGSILFKFGTHVTNITRY